MLQRLSLAANLLSGAVPPGIGALTQLVYLDLSENRLSGSVPDELERCGRLEVLRLHCNPELVVSEALQAAFEARSMRELSWPHDQEAAKSSRKGSHWPMQREND